MDVKASLIELRILIQSQVWIPHHELDRKALHVLSHISQVILLKNFPDRVIDSFHRGWVWVHTRVIDDLLEANNHLPGSEL